MSSKRKPNQPFLKINKHTILTSYYNLWHLKSVDKNLEQTLHYTTTNIQRRSMFNV